MLGFMALEDDDRQAIGQMISDALRRSTPPTASSGSPSGDWDRMSRDDQRAQVRRDVEDRIKELDDDAERQMLKARNQELEAELTASKKRGARTPARAASGAQGGTEGEQTPTVVSKFYRLLFGDANAR
jgi:hypothetical protein